MRYTLTSIPCGWAVDKLPYDNVVHCSARLKQIQAGGFIFLAICFVLIGPFRYPTKFEFLDHIAFGWIGMVIKGIGSSGNNAG